MAILPIATVGHPEQKIVAKEVTREELASAEVQQFIDDLQVGGHHSAAVLALDGFSGL